MLQFNNFLTARFVLTLEGFLVEQSSHIDVILGEKIGDPIIVLGSPLVEEGCEVEHLSRFDFITNS